MTNMGASALALPKYDLPQSKSDLFGNGTEMNISSTVIPDVTTTHPSPNTTDVPIHYKPCQWILYTEINYSRLAPVILSDHNL